MEYLAAEPVVTYCNASNTFANPTSAFLTFLAFPSSATVRPSSESEDFPKQFLASLPVSQYKISMKETSENPNMRPNSPPT